MIATIAVAVLVMFIWLHVATVLVLYRLAVRLTDLEARTETVLRPRIQAEP